MFGEQVVSDTFQITQTLQSSIHIARVAEIVQANYSVHGLKVHIRVFFILINRFSGFVGALSAMVNIVLSLAAVIAILGITTRAHHSHRFVLLAECANIDLYIAVVVLKQELAHECTLDGRRAAVLLAELCDYIVHALVEVVFRLELVGGNLLSRVFINSSSWKDSDVLTVVRCD